MKPNEEKCVKVNCQTSKNISLIHKNMSWCALELSPLGIIAYLEINYNDLESAMRHKNMKCSFVN